MFVPLLRAQQNCANTISLSNGYSVSITNVIQNANGTNTITLRVLNNGCSGCKKLNELTVQAAQGTYSNVSVATISGAFTYASINMGPTLSGTTLKGFRINNTNGIGNGQAAAFSVTYTLSGPFQNQQVLLKTSSSTLTASFTAGNFQSVKNCLALSSNACANIVTLSEGYTAAITNVVPNANGSNTITLTVLNNGCSGCRKLDHMYVQAAPGTYSNISVQSLSGNVTFSSINMGPTLPGVSIQGFKVFNINGVGNGLVAAFTVTYTLSGPLQSQQVILRTTSPYYTASFTAANFQTVSSCLYPPPPPPSGIEPYFEPAANKLYDIIGVELTSLYNKYANGGSAISDDIFQLIGTSVRVSIRTQPGQHANAVNLLTGPNYGLVQELNDPTNNLLNGTIPILNLLSLNLLPNLLVSARPIYSPINNAGLITSQGDTAMRSFRARGVFGVDGTGIKVGVLSDSYNTITGDPAADDVVRKDLPGPANPDHPNPVQVLQDFPLGTRTDEGRAMLQIIHDVAPGADLAFRTGFLGPVDFAKGIRDLKDAGCNVIVDDITYISEPFFRDGVVAQAVNEVKAQGVSYFSAAGNFGTNSWQGTFAPVAAPTGVTGQAHNFANGTGGPADILQSIMLYQGDYTIVFQWDDGTTGTTTNSDFDIYLATSSGSALFGFNRMNIGGDAFEVLPFVVTADSVLSNILIVRESGTGNATLKYVVYRGKVKVNEYGGFNASTIAGQANAAGAIAVGAVLYTNTPQYGVATPPPASFSSRGGTPVNGQDRFKPDIMGPNGVNTSVNLGGVNIDGDLFPNFFGTSAAAPHAAGLAALLLEARTKFYGDVLTPDGVKNILQNSAIDMGTPGYDVASGAGYITADNALSQLGNPAPFITSISYDTTLTPGVDPITLTIYGEYLNQGAAVFLGGTQLTTGVQLLGDSALITLVEPFPGLYPAIQVYNPPMAGTNGTDGGLSNPLYFTTKKSILVSVDNKSKKYGEVLPEFTAVYTVEGVNSSVPLAGSELTPEEQARIQSIGITTIANSLSNVGLWGIEPNNADPLSPNSNVPATSAMDISLLDRYNVVFRNGVLTIDPADLKITARDTTIVYGEAIEGLNFNYVLSDGAQGALNITPSDNQAIVSAVASTRGTALVNATGLVRGTALVNNDGEQLLTDDILNNFSFMISQAVASTRGTALVNGELIDPAELYTATALTNSGARLVRGTALVNGFTLVRGTALVNTIDSLGTITNTSALTNAGSLVNSGGVVNSSAISLNSNTQTLVILGDEDVSILAGDTPGEVVLRSVNLITGNTVGTHLILPGTFISNNFNISYGLGTLTILPATAQFTITPGSLTQVYDGQPRSVAVSVVPADVPYTVTYNGSTALPVNAGTYTVQVTVDDPNYVGSATATLVIQKGNPQISIAPASLTQVYSTTPRTVSVSTTPAGVPFTVTYNGSTNAPVNAGSYAVVVTVNTANYQGTANATLVVQKAPATASTGIYVINKGQALCPFTATYSGFLGGQTSSVVTSTTFTLSPNYTGQAGVYQIIVNATAANYTFTSVNGTLYVNPAGSGTKQVKPTFICFENLSTPVNGYSKVAWFNYDNPNNTPVYIPYGTKNSVTATSFDGSQRPTVFMPGVSAPIAIPFNGSSISWKITSNKNNGTVGSITANSSNTVCTSPGVKNLVLEEEPAVTEVKVYPNPSAGRVFLEFPELAADAALVEVYNAMGARCAVRVDRAADQRLELDLSANGQGMYIIQVLRDGNIESFRVIIE
ncbi:MAG: S8 family serine peptidase [Flavobacteriales bacterium]|nr:S8 family serine peptidase [Flavobacteriales bacterium]